MSVTLRYTRLDLKKDVGLVLLLRGLDGVGSSRLFSKLLNPLLRVT